VLDVCYDPQTSGGLLVSVDAAYVETIVAELAAAGVPVAAIGDVVEKATWAVQLR
jgi:selenide,water dikinase